MLAQVSRWGNSQGIRISKKMLKNIGIDINDRVEIVEKDNSLIIKPINKKTIEWYLEGYENEFERYDWGDLDEPKGRELL